MDSVGENSVTMMGRRRGREWLAVTWATVTLCVCLAAGTSADKGKPMISDGSVTCVLYQVSRRGAGSRVEGGGRGG